MTPKQREMARHALGLPNGQRRSYRNRYFTDATGATGRLWLAMVAEGLAGIEPTPAQPHDFFYLTRAGAEMALKGRERLCPEDFPNG